MGHALQAHRGTVRRHWPWLMLGLLAACLPAPGRAADLGAALDNADLIWVSGGDGVWSGQGVVTHDGADAAASGAIGNSQETWLETTVEGPGVVSFFWKVSSEQNWDFLTFAVDGTVLGSVTGEVDWQLRQHQLGPGSHTLRWSYKKDYIWFSGSDAAWVDQVSWRFVNVPRLLSVLSANPASGASVSLGQPDFTGLTRGATPWTTVWAEEFPVTMSAGLSAGGNAFASWTGCDATGGEFAESCALSMGSDRTATANYQHTPIADALDSGAAWTTGGDANWLGHAATSHRDGVDAAMSGAIGDSQSSWIETTVTGPGVLSFFWKTSSADTLQFSLDGGQLASIAGSTSWLQRTVRVPAGDHAARWTYLKNASGSSGWDRGWLDQVQFFPESQSWSLTVNATNPANVPIVIAPVDNAGQGSGTTPLTRTYPQSLPVTLTAPFSAGGNVFQGWSGCDATSGIRGEVCSVALAGLKTVTAAYEPGVTLGQAVDDTSLTWTPGGNANWLGQPDVTHDGSDAAQSGAIQHSQSSFFETTVTGPGVVRFFWKVSSEGGYDRLSFSIGGVVQPGAISGETDWQEKIFPVGPGSTVLRWAYAKDSSVSSNQDAGWVDQVVWQTTVVTHSLAVNSTNPGVGLAVSVSPADSAGLANGLTPLARTFYHGTGVTLTAPDGPAFGGWQGCDSVSGSGGAICTLVLDADRSVTASYAPGMSLGEAVDAAGWSWSTGGASPWYGQTVTTNDGTDAARSGVTGNGQSSWLETGVTGPGVISFAWKSSSQSDEFGSDQLRFLVDGTLQATIAGETAWERRLFNVAAGSHALRWQYLKNGNGRDFQDAAFIDQVAWQPTGATHVVNVNSSNPSAGVAIAANAVDTAALADGTTPFSRTHSEGMEVRLTAPLIHTAAGVSTLFTGWSGCTGTGGARGEICTASMTADRVVSAAYGDAIPLAAAVDNNATWTQGGNAPWIGQAFESRDGVDAGRSGPIANSQSSWFETTVSGPGTVSFSWRVSSASGDNLSFAIDTVTQSAANGESGWQQQWHNVGPGDHVLRWTYAKNSSGTAGSDAAWVDQVLWQPSAATSTLSVQSTDPAGGVAIALSTPDNAGGKNGNTPFVRTYSATGTVLLTAPQAAPGNNLFRGWSGCDSTSGTLNSVCTVSLAANRNVTAAYGPHALEVTSLDPDSGVTVVVNPADSGGMGDGQTPFTRMYAAATAVTLTAPAATGSNSLFGWSGCNAVGGDHLANCSVSMSGDRKVTAFYLARTRGLTVQAGGPVAGVWIDAGPLDKLHRGGGTAPFARSFKDGTAVTLTAPLTVGAAWFTGWSGCTGTGGARGEVCTAAMGADRTVTAAYINPELFFDAFTHGTARGDRDWGRVSGTWGVDAKKRFASGSTAALNLALVKKFLPKVSPRRAGRIETRTLLTSAAPVGPNARLVFSYLGPTKYRYVEFTRGKVRIGQVGIFGGATGKVWRTKLLPAVKPGAMLAPRVDLYADGRVKVYLKDKLVLAHKFRRGVAGGVGVAADRARSLFDDYRFLDPVVLP